MFEPDPEWAALLAADDAARAELPEQEPPAWLLDCLPAAELSPGQRIDRLVALERQLARLHAEQLRVLAAIDRADPSTERWSQEAVMCALKVSANAAQTRLKTARTLVEDLPATLAGLTSGAFSARHAEAIAEASWKLPADAHPEYEAAVLARAAEQSLPELRRTVKAAAIAVDPATAQARQARAREDRCLRTTPAEDGMAELRLTHTADAIQALYQRIDAATRLLPVEDPRTRDQQRADLAIDAVLAGIPADALPELQGRRPSIQVVVAADTLLGLDDQPAQLTGHGPITAQHARELAAAHDATWRRLLTDPDTGQLLDYGRTTYRPPPDLTDFILARDPVCFFPHCHQPGYLCDIDHTTPWNHGGHTCPGNNRPGCRRHHICKTRSIFSYRITRDGAYTWTSDTGHTYTSHPPQPPTPRRHQPNRAEQAQRAKTESEHDRRHREDRDYAQLERWLQTEIQREHHAGRTGHAQAAQRALTDAQRQRHHQLKAREDPDHIPF